MRITEASRRALPAVLMASTMLASADAASAAAVAATSASSGTTLGEVIVTASKREENLQKVAVSVQAIDGKAIQQLNITGFNDYVKFIPSLQAQGDGTPNSSIIYMRGVSDGGDGNHSGPEPSVGTYLDEQPVTTIGGTLDIHIYDVARIEVLPGPQGTLYGASSEAGTLKIVTNQPSTSGFYGALDVQGNVVDHGSEGYVVEGFVNIPITSDIAVRLVGFDEHDAGYIDNVPGTRYFPTPGTTINNNAYVRNNFNPIDTFGGRAAVKFDLNDNWTVTPSVIAQDTRADGVFGYEPSVGDLEVQRFAPDSDHDRWVQAAMTIRGKLGRYDLTYSGGYFNRAVDTLSDYTDYSVAYDQSYGSGYFWNDHKGVPLANPQQEIVGRDRFEKGSNEIRLASPSTDRFRFLVGLFQERQTHWIIQDYQIQGFGAQNIDGQVVQAAIPGWPNTYWLTDQNRIDRDEAAFGEASFDITPKLSITAGVRGYDYKNTLVGFYGFSAATDTAFDPAPPTPTMPGPPGMGVDDLNCLTGERFRNAPCVNLNKTVSASGETHKVNMSYKIDGDKLVYFTYSTGYRPGGVNRNGALGPYQADSLDNYEIGWKTSWLDNSLRWNGALYDEQFDKFQFSFLGQYSLTVIQNAPSAQILGAETSLDWRATRRLTLSGGGAYNDAKLTANFCGADTQTGAIIATCSNAYAAANGGALQGQQLPYVPKLKGNVTARYTFDMAGWNAHAQATVAFQSLTYPALRVEDLEALGTMPAYATLDLAIGAERGKTSVELFVKNLTDSRAQTNRFSPCDTCEAPTNTFNLPPNQFQGPAIYVSTIAPLTVGLRLGQKF
jgi:outer membrane receptor protein involved in Fe transport